MNMHYEWQIFDTPDGLVSVVVRMSSAEAASLVAVDLSDPAQPDPVTSQATQRLLIEALQRAVADGGLVPPPTP
jgi:hypothetical protein